VGRHGGISTVLSLLILLLIDHQHHCQTCTCGFWALPFAEHVKACHWRVTQVTELVRIRLNCHTGWKHPRVLGCRHIPFVAAASRRSVLAACSG
jgi:hypothetical protein